MSRLETVKTKYPSIDWEVAKLADPSKNFKYLDWIGLNFAKSSTIEIKDILGKFEKYKDKLSEKDIAKYDIANLKKKLDELGPSAKEAKEAGSVILDDVDNVKIVMLEGKEAVTKYTAGTRWCISNYGTFVSYAKDNNIFVLTANKTKMCVVYNGSFRNEYSVWVPDDTKLNISNGAVKYLMTFLGVESKSLTKAIEKCAEFTKDKKNFWYQLEHNTITDEMLQRVVENQQESQALDMLWDNYHAHRADSRIRVFVKYIAQNKDKYPTFVSKITTAGNKYISYNYDSYYGGYDSTTLPGIWENALKSLEPKVKKKTVKAKKVKKSAKASSKITKKLKKKLTKKKAAKKGRR